MRFHNTLIRPIMFVLVIGGVVQVVILFNRLGSQPVVIARDAPLPVEIRRVSDGSPALENGRCATVFLLNATCPYCRMGPDEREEYTGLGIDVTWAIVGSRETADQFGAEFGYRHGELGFVDRRLSDGFIKRPQRLRIPGTPMRVMLDADHVVKSLTLGAIRPTVEEINDTCK